MNWTTTARSITPFVLGLMALAFAGLGVFGLIRAKPFVLSARWLLFLFVLCFSPSLVMQIAMMADMRGHPRAGSLGALSLISLLILVVVVGFMALVTRGYLVFSATQSSFREGLLAALARLGLPFEETMAAIHLPTVPADLHVAVQGWIGTGQVRLKKGNGRPLLRQLAKAMNAQYAGSSVATNRTWAVVYLILGILVGVMVVLLGAA